MFAREDTYSSESRSCPGTEELLGKNGTGYRGCQDQTISGVTCQSWAAQSPHNHSFSNFSDLSAGLGHHNYCRNPWGTHGTIWCYTMDVAKPWEPCVPKGALKEPLPVTRSTCKMSGACKLGT